MHVSLHQAFKGYAEARPEADLYQQVLTAIDMSAEDFEAEPYHDDAEMDRAVEAAAAILETDRMEFLTGWGVGISQGLLDAYQEAIDPTWKVLDLLEHIESRMHVHSREEFGARPPVLNTSRLSETELRIEVETSKNFTGLAKGFVLGFADSFGETVALTIDERPDGFTFDVVADA